uniref:Sep15_SelM domain-containing protein n=1 Tax=Echinostoma caproni TaxID=27848 RepID=A0A183A767_9TREM
LATAVSPVNVYAVDRKTCQVSGFTKQLKCSSCHELKAFNLTSLEESCMSCCKDDETAKQIKKSPFVELIAFLGKLSPETILDFAHMPKRILIFLN